MFFLNLLSFWLFFCRSDFYFNGVKFITLFLNFWNSLWPGLSVCWHQSTSDWAVWIWLGTPGIKLRQWTPEPQDTGHVRRSHKSLTELNLSVPGLPYACCVVLDLVRWAKSLELGAGKVGGEARGCIGPTEEVLGKCQMAIEVKLL